MSGILIMVGIFVLIWFVMLRPQRKKMQAQQALLGNLDIGDDVLTSGGIYGRISSFDGDSLYIEVSDDNFLKITRSSIAQKISYDSPPDNNGSTETNASEDLESPESEKQESSEQETD